MPKTAEFEPQITSLEIPTLYIVTYHCLELQENFDEERYVSPQELWPAHVPCHFHLGHEAFAVDAVPVIS